MPLRSNVALIGMAPAAVIDVAVMATSFISPNVPSPPLRSRIKVSELTVETSSSRSNIATILAGDAVRLLFGSGDNEVTRMGFVDAARSSTAPSVIHCRMVVIDAAASAGWFSGILPPIAAVPSSF